MEALKECDLRYRTAEAELTRYLSRNSHLQSLDPAQFEKFGENYAAALIESNEHRRRLADELKSIKKQVEQCSSIVNCIIPDMNNEHMTKKLKIELEKTQKSVFDFKQRRIGEFEDLVNNETGFQREIDTILKRAEISEREKTVPKRASGKMSGPLFGAQDHRPKAVQRFQNYMAKHGETDGWNSVDHMNFAKLWTKMSDKEGDVWDEEAFLAAVESYLPGRSTDEILAHVKFHRHLCKLKLDQQRAIEDWKLQRQAKNENQPPEIEETIERSSRQSKREQHAAAKRKEQAQKWREQQNAKADRQRAEEIALANSTERIKKEELGQRKKILQMRDLQRQRDADAAKKAKEFLKQEEIEYKRQKGIEANDKVKQLTCRDIIQRKHQKIDQKESERIEILENEIKETRRKQKNDQLASWDPTRLYQPTAAHRRRVITEESKTEQKRFFILQPGGLATASWRTGL